jgi:hypothetical protein
VPGTILSNFFHGWERRLAAESTDRVVRPFEWGADWIPQSDCALDASAETRVSDWVSQVLTDSDAFFTPEPTTDYALERRADGNRLMFASALATPHVENNTVYCQYFPASRAGSSSGARRGSRAAVLVLPQWNADPNGHIGLCKLLAWSGLSVLRLTLPYHERRMPPELQRADYIVSANVARTLQVCRQAVLDARRAVAWLAQREYARIGILGTSLGSCMSILTTAHEPLIQAQALNHISPHVADVVWRGLSTRHVRQGLDGHIDLERLRALWQPISPLRYLDRLRDRQTLLVYARYDLTFPIDLSKEIVDTFRTRNLPHAAAVLPCGHYSTAKAPFKYVDAWVLTRFLRRALLGPASHRSDVSG